MPIFVTYPQVSHPNACILLPLSFSDGEWKLLLISQASSVGVLPHGGEVYCVERIAIISLTKDSNPEIVGLEVWLEGGREGEGGGREEKGGREREREIL